MCTAAAIRPHQSAALAVSGRRSPSRSSRAGRLCVYGPALGTSHKAHRTLYEILYALDVLMLWLPSP